MTKKTIYYSPEMILTTKFYKFPKWLIAMDIKDSSKILYMLLLERYNLSLENGWIDDQNRVYIIYSRKTIERLMNVGHQKCVSLFNELNENNLLEEKRQGQSKPNIIYLKSLNYDVIKTNMQFLSDIYEDEKDSFSYQKYENHTSEDEKYENHTSGGQKYENHTSRSMKTTHQEVLKSYPSKTNLNKTKTNKNAYYNNNSDNSKYGNTTIAGVEGHGNQVVVENTINSYSFDKPKAKGFDRDRFVQSRSVQMQMQRLLEAEYDSPEAHKKIDVAVNYYEASCNCFGLDNIEVINNFSEEENGDLFRVAYELANDSPLYTNIINDKGYMSAEIKKRIENHAT